MTDIGTERPAIVDDADEDGEGLREIYVRPEGDHWRWWVRNTPGWNGIAPTRDAALYYAGWWMGQHDAGVPNAGEGPTR